MIHQSILVVDDSDDIHRLLDVRLGGDGLRLYHATDSWQGVAMALQLQPDMILLDVGMPVLDGFGVCQQLKADPSTAHIPVVFLTGASDVDAKVRGFDIGAVDYVTKPFDPVELRARIRSTLRTKRFQDLLSSRAQVDGLTGLKNRAYFDQRLSEEVCAAARYGRDVCLVMLDLDHFKSLNDDHGHPFGDLVLQRTGELLAARCRATDAACRYGGEEFALILTETTPPGALILAERLRQDLRELDVRSRGKSVTITASFGVGYSAPLAEQERLTVRTLLEAADGALYAAKRAGRDRIELASHDPGT